MVEVCIEGVIDALQGRVNGDGIDGVFNVLYESLGQLQNELKAKNKPSKKEIGNLVRFDYNFSHDGPNDHKS